MLSPLAGPSNRRGKKPAEKSQPDADEVKTWVDTGLESKLKGKRLLDWWSKNGNQYPGLALMARDVLPVPISSVAVERVFNMARDIVSYRRGQLKPETIRKLMITKYHLQRQRQRDSPGGAVIRRELSPTRSIEKDQTFIDGTDFEGDDTDGELTSSDDEVTLQDSPELPPQRMLRKPFTQKSGELRSGVARSEIARSGIVRSEIATSKPLPSTRPKNASKKAVKKSSPTASADEGVSHAPLSADSSSGEHGNQLERELFGDYTDGESEEDQYGSLTLDEAELLESSQYPENLPSTHLRPVITVSGMLVLFR